MDIYWGTAVLALIARTRKTRNVKHTQLSFQTNRPLLARRLGIEVAKNLTPVLESQAIPGSPRMSPAEPEVASSPDDCSPDPSEALSWHM
jgi:hypothetical protein